MSYVAKQRRFVDFCRKGGKMPAPHAEIYRKLIWETVKQTLDKAYPIAKHALKEKWDELCLEFFSEQKFLSPELWKMPKALIGYVQDPKLSDLLRFEWLEIELEMMADRPYKGDPPILNPHHSIDHFHYPVFRVPFEKLWKGDFYLLSFRHPKKLNVCFIELGPLYVEKVKQFAQRPRVIDDHDFVTELIEQGAVY